MAERRPTHELHELDDDQLIAAVRATDRRAAGPPPDWNAMSRAIGEQLDAVDRKRERSWLGRFWYVPALASATAALLAVLVLRPGDPGGSIERRVATVANPAVPDPDAVDATELPGEPELLVALAEPALSGLRDTEIDALEIGAALAVDDEIDAMFAELDSAATDTDDDDAWDAWLVTDDDDVDFAALEDLTDEELDLLAARIAS